MKRLGRLLIPAVAVVLTIAPPALTKVKITWSAWGTNDNLKWNQQTTKDFNKENPDIELVYRHGTDPGYHDKLLTQVVGGVEPDVFALGEQYLPIFVEKGALTCLEPYIKKSLIDDVFPQSLLEFCRIKRKLWTLPSTFNPLVIHHNDTLFGQAGLTRPDIDWNWSEFLSYSKKLTRDINGDGTPEQWGFSFGTWFGPIFPWIWANGGQIFDEDYTQCLVDSPAAIEGLQFLADLIYKHKVSGTAAQEGKLGGADTMFTTGKLGMNLSGRWVVPPYSKVKTLKWGVASIPAGRKGRSTFLPSATMVVSKHTPNLKEAIRVWEYIIGPKEQARSAKEGNVVPSWRSVAYSDAFVADDAMMSAKDDLVFLETAKYGKPIPAFTGWMDVWAKAFAPELDKLWGGKQSAAQATASIAALANRMMK